MCEDIIGSSIVGLILDFNETNASYTLNNFIQDLSSSEYESVVFYVYERTMKKVDWDNFIAGGVADKKYLLPVLSHPNKIKHGNFTFFYVKNYIPLPSSIVFDKLLKDRSLSYDKFSVLIIMPVKHLDYEDFITVLNYSTGHGIIETLTCCDVLTKQSMKYKTFF